MASSLDVNTILNRLRENDTSLRFLFISSPPYLYRTYALKSGASFSECLQQYLDGYLLKSDFIEHLSTLFHIHDPIFIETIDFDQLFLSLSTNTALNHLVIDGLSISDPQLAQLSQWLASNSGLATLSLRRCKISSFGGCRIAESLRTNSTLTSLKLQSNFVGKEAAMALGESLRNNSTLTSLNLSANSIEKEGGMALGESLRTNSTLTSLNLSYNSIEKEAGMALGESLRTNSTLTSLNLYDNSVGNEAGMAFGESLRTNSTLTSLYLGNNSVGKEAGMVIGESLRTNSTLTSLNLQSNSVGKEAAMAIGESLRNNSTLTFLDLSYNSVQEGAMAIGESLRTNSTLASLDLSRNSVGKEGGITIGKSLQPNSTLTSLDISLNSVANEGAMALGESLRTNSTLTSLNLSRNSVGNEGGMALGESLRTNSTLTSLNLSHNSVGKEGGITIGKSLQTNSTLISLNLYNNSIENEGIFAISRSLSLNYSLISLPIGGTSFPPVDAKIIKSHLRFRRTLHDRFSSFFSSQFPQFNSLSILASSDERAILKPGFQTFYKQYFRQSLAEHQNILSLNEIKQRQNPRNGLIVELNGLLAATPLNPQAILTRLQEMSASVDELYRSPLPPPTPIPSSSSSSPQSSSSSPLPSSLTSSSSPLPSPFSSSTFDIGAFVALQTQLVSLLQALLDRYPTILSELREQEAAVRSLAFEEYAQRVSSTISPIRDNGAAQTLMNEAITKMNRSLDLSLKTVQVQIRKIEEEVRLLRSLLTGIPQVLPLIESRIKEAQELRASMTAEHEAEVVQLKNVLGRCVQSLATLYRQQIKLFEEERQSLQTNRARWMNLGLNDRVAKIDQDIADVEVQLQTPRSLLEQVTQLAAGYGVTTTPPTMSIDELRRIGALAHFELDQSHIELGDLIGDGGMAQVFQGSFYGTPVAIKRLLKSQDFLAVQKEVKNWCHFHHPHILPFIGYTQNALIVMELMDKSLADILHLQSTLLGKSPTLDEPPLPKISFDQRFRMIWCIASGLCYLHTKEMVHRDIKSLNILVRGFVEGDVRFDIKIADFGATRSLVTLGQTTAGIKTPRWAAPELYHAGAVTTFKSDVFAYAMVMYEILTRRLPFDVLKTERELDRAFGAAERPPLTLDRELDDINPAKVNALVELMKEGWSEDPVTRPSALLILQKLRDIQKIHNIVIPEDDKYDDYEFSAADISHPPCSSGSVE